MCIELLSTSHNEASRSRLLLRRVEAALQTAGADVSFFDARDLPPALCDGRPLREYPAPYATLHERLKAADAIVIATPIHNYGPSGPCANIMGIVGSALSSKPVAVISASGSPRSHLAIGPLLLSLLFEFGILLYPGTVQTHGEGFDDINLDERVAAFADGFYRFVTSLVAPVGIQAVAVDG